jgi:Uma2 family endonuclease
MQLMTLLLSPPPARPTFSDLLKSLGDIPPERILMNPPPGTATEQDVLDLDDHEDRLCELIDGVLVEKPMSSRESMLAMMIGRLLLNFVIPRKLGAVTGESGMLRLRPFLVLIPDVAFISRQRYPAGKLPTDAIFRLAPDLAVEILSKANTRAEMARKRREYFAAGTRLVWEFDVKKRSVNVFTAPHQFKTLRHNQILDAKPVLPGLKISLTSLFAQLDQ